MAAGFDLKEGKYKFGDFSEADLWESFRQVFSSKTKNSSTYKFVFLKAIIDIVSPERDRGRYDFREIFARFTEIYWILTINYGLKQGSSKNRLTYVEQILIDYTGLDIQKNNTMTVQFGDLNNDVQHYLIERVVKDCKKYVVGALFSDTNEIFYSFNKKEEWIEFNPVMLKFIRKHKSSIEELDLFEMIRFMEKVNTKSYINLVAKKLGVCNENHSSSEILRQLFWDKLSIEVPNNNAKINSFELLMLAPDLSDDVVEQLETEEKIIEKDTEDMMHYLDDPEKVIKMLKVRKGIKI